MAEEVARPERMIPIAIMGTVTIGFVTAWFYSVAMFFSMDNLQELFETATGVPILALFYQALGSKAGAIALESLIIATGMGCQIASHTWQSRLCWSFARDRGLPGSRFLSHVDRQLDVPFRAHLVSSVIVAILGCLYLGSYTAFNRYVRGGRGHHLGRLPGPRASSSGAGSTHLMDGFENRSAAVQMIWSSFGCMTCCSPRRLFFLEKAYYRRNGRNSPTDDGRSC